MRQEELLKQHLLNNKVCVVPTDTVMGVCCLMNLPRAVNRLYRIKNRTRTKPTAVLVSDWKMASQLMKDEPDEFLTKVLSRHWPGDLTIVVEAADIVPRSITGFFHEIGIRMPNHERLRNVISDIKVPLVATSANFRGGKTPLKYNDIDPSFLLQVDFSIPEDSKGNTASTVIRYKGAGQIEYIRK